MSPHHSGSGDITGDRMEIPSAVIAQAEAAASSNQPEDGQPRSQFASGQAPEVLSSKQKHQSISANDQKYACPRSVPATSIVLHLLDSLAKR